VLVSLFAGAGLSRVDELLGRARAARASGLDGLWVPQTQSFDALAALAAVAVLVPDLRLGTAVVPIQGRHPIPLAQAALTVAEVAGPGRFTLGVGVTHRVVSEGTYGIAYTGVVDRCAEQLAALGPLLSERRAADVEGDHLVARGTIASATAPPGLLLAALGRRMLDLAGRRTDGTVTWMTGPRVLRERVVPVLTEAAEAAGRPAPRVVVGLPVCVTDDEAAARDVIGAAMATAARMPSYARSIRQEGVDRPADLALVGTRDQVATAIDELRAAGMTELVANLIGPPATGPETLDALAGWAGGRP
jgi:F420-dependent oxidoreductase-like protein